MRGWTPSRRGRHPPSIPVRACYGVHTGMPPCVCNGAAQNRVRTGGRRRVAGTPSAVRVSTTPRARSRHPTFRVPRARRPACGTACAVWHAKGGAQGSCMRDSTRGCAHTPLPAMCEQEVAQRKHAQSIAVPLSPCKPEGDRRRGKGGAVRMHPSSSCA